MEMASLLRSKSGKKPTNVRPPLLQRQGPEPYADMSCCRTQRKDHVFMMMHTQKCAGSNEP
jgi:hypothetical protein